MKFLVVGASGLLTENSTVQSSAGAGDADKIPSLDAAGKLDISMMPTGIGQDALSLTAGENLSAGNLVYINGSGQVMKADANDHTKAAVGFVLSSATSGNSVTVYFEGTITGLSGLTPGARYFLSASATGAATTTIPTGAADIVQCIGYALSTSSISFTPNTPIVRG